MNRQKQLRLLAFLEQLAEAEIAIDNIKHKLERSFCYSPIQIFERISKGADNITISMMTQYTGRSMRLTERQIHELFCRFDWSRTGRISRTNFLRQIRPFQSKRLYATQSRYKLVKEIENIFIELLNQYIERWRIHEICRQELSSILPYEAFDSIAIFKRGFIGADELNFFALKNEVELNQTKLKMMMFALKRRYHKSVNLQAFCQNLWPLQFGYYSGFELQIRNMEIQQLQVFNDKQLKLAKQSRKNQYKMIRRLMRHQNVRDQGLGRIEERKTPIQSNNSLTKPKKQNLESVKLHTLSTLELNNQMQATMQTEKDNQKDKDLLEHRILNQMKQNLKKTYQQNREIARFRTQSTQSRQKHCFRLSSLESFYPQDCKFEAKNQKTHFLSIKTKKQFQPRKSLDLSSIQQIECGSSSRLNYSFGAQHLRVYKSVQKDIKFSTINTIEN